MKRVASNSLILVIANVGSAGFGFLLSAILARALGVQGFGQYTLALAWCYALMLLADFGLATLLTRDLARQPEQTARYLLATSGLKIFIALVLILALEIAAPFLSTDGTATLALRLAAPIIFLGALYNSFTAIFRAYQRMFPILLFNLGGLFVQVLAAFILWQRGSGVVEFVVLTVVIQFAQLVAAFALYRAQFHQKTNHNITLPLLKTLTRASVPFALAAGLGAIQVRAPVLLLGALAGESAVGIFGGATRWTEALKLVPGGFIGALFPAFAALVPHNAAELERTFQRAQRAILAFGIVCATILMFAAAPIITLVFGEAFTPAIPVLQILAWVMVLNLWGNVVGLYLYALNDERHVNRIRAWGLGLQMAASALLIWQWGAVGAALAALVGESVMSALYFARMRWMRIHFTTITGVSPETVLAK